MPGNLHPKSRSIPKVWAHRGARSVAPENTLAAARAGKVQGAYGWELDVRVTLDGAVVVLHDQSLERTTDIASRPDVSPDGTADSQQLTLAQIKRLDAGGWFARADPFGAVAEGELSSLEAAAFAGEKVPTLAEALNWTRENGLVVNVEIKDMLGGDDDGLVRKTADIIRETSMTGRVLVSSFRVESLRLFRKLCPEVPVALLVNAKDLEAQSDADILGTLHELGAKALHPSLSGLRPNRIRVFRKAGFDVNVYTVNDPEDMRWLAEEGATGIFTDYPARALSVLAGRT